MNSAIFDGMVTTPCPQCGKNPGARALVCPHCGAQQPARLLRAKPDSVEDPTVRRFRITIRVFAGIGALAVVTGAVFIGYRLDPIHRRAYMMQDSVAASIASVRPGESSAPSHKPLDTTRSETLGTLTVERVWEHVADEFAYALTTYTNTTSQTFMNVVEITCDAYNAKGAKVASNHRGFWVYRTGPISPGFTGTKQIPVDMRWAGRMSSMKCAVTAAR